MTNFATDSHSNNKMRRLKLKQEFFLFLKKTRPSSLNDRTIWTRKLLRNACMWLRLRGEGNTERLLNNSERDFNATWKNRIFQSQYQKQVKMYISLLLFHDRFPLVLKYFFDVVRNKLQAINIYTRVDKKKIKSSRKGYVIRTCFKFWTMKNIFWNYKPMRVWLWLAYKFTENIVAWDFSPSSFKLKSGILTLLKK